MLFVAAVMRSPNKERSSRKPSSEWHRTIALEPVTFRQPAAMEADGLLCCASSSAFHLRHLSTLFDTFPEAIFWRALEDLPIVCGAVSSEPNHE